MLYICIRIPIRQSHVLRPQVHFQNILRILLSLNLFKTLYWFFSSLIDKTVKWIKVSGMYEPWISIKFLFELRRYLHMQTQGIKIKMPREGKV